MSAFQEGVEAYMDGLNLSDNPYDDGDHASQYGDWRGGWLEAADRAGLGDGEDEDGMDAEEREGPYGDDDIPGTEDEGWEE